MSKPAPRLGRGLSAILGPRAADTESHHISSQNIITTMERRGGDDLRHVPVDAVTPNPRQPRTDFDVQALEDLAQSIRTRGVVQPIVVRPAPAGFELVAGERRWRAARLAGLSTVPAVVRNLTDEQSLEVALIENLQREELNAIERARAFQQYLDTFQAQPEQLAERTGQSRSNIINYLRLLRLPDEVLELVAAGKLAMGQARAIAGVRDPLRQRAIARLACRRNLSARQVEELAARGEFSERSPPESAEEQGGSAGMRHMANVEQALSRAMGLQVVLRPGRRKNSGRVIIRYNTLDEFDRIAERLGGRSALE